jgi:hypothetical protein
MIDFALTDKGDLFLEKQPVFPGFKLSFRIAQFQGFTMKFFQAPPQDMEHNDHFKISFNTKAHSEEVKYRSSLVEDVKMAIQQVMIRLRTEVTELPIRQTVGSQLRTVKHERLNSRFNLSRIEAMTADALKDIVSNVEVIAKVEYGIGAFYCQNVNIYIYSSSTLFYKFSI